MSKLTIASSTGSYDVHVAQGSFAQAIQPAGNTFLLADEFFRTRLEGLAANAIFVEATEHMKSLDQAPALIEQMRAANATRATHLVAVGGGIVQDIAAFIASIYMRGLAWTYLPTTVLAMDDSCIGGKSSINVGPYKNLAGTFHPPQSVVIDPALALTLPASDFASGLVEAAKITFCRGPQSFTRYLAQSPSPHMSVDALEAVLLESLTAKKQFIEIDEFDKKERLLLNFGHTFGHAIEGAGNYTIPHGIAVGLGILCALAFERQRGIPLTGGNVSALEQHLRGLTSTLANLPHLLAALSVPEILNRFASDKKHTASQYTLILPNEDGVSLVKLDRTEALRQQLQQAIQSTLASYGK